MDGQQPIQSLKLLEHINTGCSANDSAGITVKREIIVGARHALPLHWDLFVVSIPPESQ